MCCWVEEEPTANHRAPHTPGPHSSWRGQSHCQVPTIPTGTPHGSSLPLLPDQSTSQLGPCLIQTEGSPSYFWYLPLPPRPLSHLSEAQWPLASSLTSRALLFLPATHVFPRRRGLPALTSSCWNLHTNQAGCGTPMPGALPGFRLAISLTSLT